MSSRLSLRASPQREHHGELQPLRLVDAQDAHAAPSRPGAGRASLAPFLPQPGQVGQKAEQALVARPSKRRASSARVSRLDCRSSPRSIAPNTPSRLVRS